MREAIAKLLVMLAVLLMPLGMAPAAAAQHHSAAAQTAMPHCPDQAPANHANGAIPACTMACASALPAADLARAQPMPVPDAPIVATVVHALDGLHPETATPPPKLA